MHNMLILDNAAQNRKRRIGVLAVLIRSLVETRHCFGLVPELRGALDRHLSKPTHTTNTMQSGISGTCLAVPLI